MIDRHVVLIGLPGAGKSTVGPLLARRLGRRFVDIDSEIESATGRTVVEIFAQDGEREFRRMEHQAMLQTLEGPSAVIAPGGGWAVQPGALDGAAAHAFTIYMECDPDVAALRLGSAAGRPLLAGGDHRTRIRALHAARHPIYVSAVGRVDANRSDPDQVADAIEQMLGQEYK